MVLRTEALKDSYNTMLKMEEICQRDDPKSVLRRRTHSEFQHYDRNRNNTNNRNGRHVLSNLDRVVHNNKQTMGSNEMMSQSAYFFRGYDESKRSSGQPLHVDALNASLSSPCPIYATTAQNDKQRLQYLQRKLDEFANGYVIGSIESTMQPINMNSSSSDGEKFYDRNRNLERRMRRTHSRHRRPRVSKNFNSSGEMEYDTSRVKGMSPFFRLLKKRLIEESFNGSKRIPAHRIPALMYQTGYCLNFDELLTAIKVLGWKKDRLVDMSMIMSLLYIIEENRRSAYLETMSLNPHEYTADPVVNKYNQLYYYNGYYPSPMLNEANGPMNINAMNQEPFEFALQRQRRFYYSNDDWQRQNWNGLNPNTYWQLNNTYPANWYYPQQDYYFYQA